MSTNKNPSANSQHAGINKAFEESLKKAMAATEGCTRQINNLLAARERMRLTSIMGDLTEDAIRKAMVSTIHSLLYQVSELPDTPCPGAIEGLVCIRKDSVERILGNFLGSVTQEQKPDEN